MVKNIVFDMGNVLFAFDVHRFVTMHASTDENARLLENGVFKSVAWVEYDRGCISAEHALQKIASTLPSRLHDAAIRLFKEWNADIQPDEAIFALISRLKQQGFRIYLLSNAAENFYTFRSKLPGLNLFDGIFVSCDWHLSKPDAAIFRTFCAHFSLVPSECFFIDDLPPNVEGALRCGFSGVVYHGDTEELEQQINQVICCKLGLYM